jgi:hypothetical protein
MRKIAITMSAAAFLALPAAAAPAAEIPEINCGIVSCTYPIERKLDTVKECVDGAVRAVEYALQGTPQPQECRLG